MNSHNLALSQAFSDRLLGLGGGRILYDGPVAGADKEVLDRIYASAGMETAASAEEAPASRETADISESRTDDSGEEEA